MKCRKKEGTNQNNSTIQVKKTKQSLEQNRNGHCSPAKDHLMTDPTEKLGISKIKKRVQIRKQETGK
jgi:hypothetical protein